MTGPGTNTFLLGHGRVVAVDPGPADPRHLAAIQAALAAGERIEAILVTHPHLDHSGLAPALARATGAPVHGFGPAGSGRSAAMHALAGAGLPGGGEGVDAAFRPDVALHAGVLDLAGLRIEVVPTPGHMGEHLAFGWNGFLLTGDHVMGWAPSLVSPPDGDMAAYMASLAALAARDWAGFLPAHGDPIRDAAGRLADLAAHRRGREAQVLAALGEGPADLGTVTARVYSDLAPALLPAASRNALAHLIDLIGQNRVTASPWPNPAALFRLV
jgi:hydroxyacylglutathione hydrolase